MGCVFNDIFIVGGIFRDVAIAFVCIKHNLLSTLKFHGITIKN